MKMPAELSIKKVLKPPGQNSRKPQTGPRLPDQMHWQPGANKKFDYGNLESSVSINTGSEQRTPVCALALEI